MIQKRRTTLWIPALFHHLLSNLWRQVSAGILRKKKLLKVLKSIFKCSICLNTASACTSCYAVMGCIPCVKQWHASSANASQCPLCRTSMNYVVIPVLRVICNLIGTPVHNSAEEPGAGSDTDTIPYGVGD